MGNMIDDLMKEIDISKALDNQNTAFQTITDIGLGKLKYVDGDTAVDPLTGVIFRFRGFDTLETQDSKKAQKVGISTDLYSTPLKDMIESGSLTANDLYNRMNGVDTYGRVLVDIPELTTASILAGVAVPSNKYDQKNQEIYRKYIEKNQDLLGEDRLKNLNKLREYDLDQTEYNMGIWGRIKNDLKTVGASFSRAGAMILDLGLDTTFKALDTFLGTDIGDSTYFSEKKTKQYQDALWGVNTLNKDFNMKEAVHEFKLGKYGSALLTATAHADELFADSSGDMLMLFTGVGEATAFLKAKGMLEGIKTLAKGNAGLLLHAAGMANTDLEERAKLNKDGKTSVAEALSTFGAEIAVDLLDKASFETLFKGNGEKIQALKQVIAGLGGSDRAIVAKAIGKNLIDIGSKAGKGMLYEGTSEAIQEYIQILAETLGTDEKGYILPTGDEVTDRVIEAGLAGAGMGIGLSGSINNVSNVYKEVKAGYEKGLNSSNNKNTDNNTEPTINNIEPADETSKQEKDIIAKEENIAPISPIKEEETQSKIEEIQSNEIEETQPATEEVTPIEQETKQQKVTSKEHIKKGAEELDKNFDEIAKVFDDIPNIKTPEDRNNFIKKSDNFVNKILQHFTKEQLTEAIKIRNEIQKKLIENPENEVKMQNGDTLGIGSKEGYTAQDLMDIYSIIDTINNIQTQKKIQENILKNNPITRQSLDANEDNKNDIIKEASKLNIDEINSLLDRAVDEDSKQIFEEALEDKRIVEDNSDLNNNFFYGDSSSTGFFDIDKNDEKALKAYKQSKINEYNEASKALNESKANNNKPISILNNSRTIRANNSLDNQYVNNLKKEVDFLNSYKPEPKVTPEEVANKIKEEKDKKQTLKERQSVGSIITDIDKTETRQEAKETLIKGFKRLKQEGTLDKYKQDLLKAYKSKVDTLNEPIAKTEPNKEETEENKARRLEKKLDELDTQLKNIFNVKSKEDLNKAQQENYKKKEELRIKLKALRNKQKQLHKKRKNLEDEIRKARKKKKEEIAKVKEKKLSALRTVINKIKNATEAVIEKIKAFLTDVDKEQKKVKALIEEIQKEIRPLTEKQNIAKKRKLLLKEYRRRLQKTGKLTDKVISQIKYIDKGFYKFIKELNLPKGIQLNSLDAVEKIMKLSRPIDGYNGSDFSSKEKEIKYFNEVVKPLVIDVRNLIRRISDRGEIFKRVFNTEDAFKYNELLKGLNEELLTNLVTAVTIDSMMNYGGLMAQINTDEEIAEFLGLTSSKEVTPAMRQKFGYGKLRTTIVANMQNMINEYIYLKSLEPMAKEKFGTAIALLATHVMKESSITNIEEVKIPVSELNKYRTTPYNSNEAKSVNILRAKQNISFEKRPSIRGKGKSIVNKVFSIREKKERTEPLQKHKNEAIDKLQHTPRQIKQEIIDLYNELGEEKFRDFLRAILGYDERVTDNYKSHTVHVSKEASIKGKNLQIDDSIDALIAAIEQVGNQPIYFKYEKKSEHRLHLMAELINPQSNKLHRFATNAVNSKRTVDTKDDDKMLIWKSAILDGLGIKWKNEDDIEFEFEALFEDNILMSYLKNDIKDNTDINIEDNKLVKEFLSSDIKSPWKIKDSLIDEFAKIKNPKIAKEVHTKLRYIMYFGTSINKKTYIFIEDMFNTFENKEDILDFLKKNTEGPLPNHPELEGATYEQILHLQKLLALKNTLEYYSSFSDSETIHKKHTYSFVEVVQKYEEEAHSLTALIELKKYYNRVGDTFETTLEKETDSQNSGSTLQSIFYFNPLNPDSIKMLHKGGIFTNSTDVTKSSEYDGLDNYEESTQNFHNNIIDENNEYEHNRPPEPPRIRQGEKKLSIGANNAHAAKVSRYNLYNSFFLPLLGTWAKTSTLTPEYLAQGRKFFKHEIIAKGYTAGDKSIQVNKFDETIDAFYSLLEDITSEPTEHNIQKVLTLINALQYYNKAPDGNLVRLKDRDGKDIAPMFWGEEHQNINALIEVLSKLNKLQQVKKPNLKTKGEILQLKESISYFEFNEKQLNMLLTNYRKTMGKVVTDSMNKVLEPLSFGTKLIQKLSNMHNKLFLTQFFEELDKVAEKQGYITKENMADITNRLVQKGIAPVIDAYDGSLAELMKRGFNEQINDIIDQKQYEVKVGTAHTNDSRLELSTQTIGASSWVDIGVRSPALTTLMADASVMSNIIKSTDMKDMGLYIFDAILSANGGAKQYNGEIKALIDSGYSPILATIKSIKKAFKDFEWNKANINKILNSSIRDESETKPYRQWTIARLIMFHEEISKKIKDKDQLDAYMLNAVSSTIVDERGEIKFDGIPIDFFTELYNLNRTNLKQSITSIDHNIGVNDQIEINENRDFRPNIDEYKVLYDKYKKQTNSELSTDESLEKLRNDIDNYISIDDMRNISLYESIAKKGSNIQIVINQMKGVISAIEKLGDKLINLSDKEIMTYLKENSIDISQINQNLLRQHLVQIREAKRQTKEESKKSLDTEEQFTPKQKITVTKDNLIDVYDTIDSLSNDNLDETFGYQLKTLLETLVMPVIEKIAVSIGKTSNMSFGEAIGSHIANIAISTKKSKGLFISAQEVYAHELVHNVTDNALKHMNVFTYQILDIMKDIKKKHGNKLYTLFLNPDMKHTKADIKLAKQMANHVFGDSGRLSEFIAYALTNKNFRSNLSGMDSIDIHLDKSSWFSRISSLFQIAIEKFKQLLTTGKIDSNLQGKIDSLVKNSVGISIHNNNKAISSFLSGINAIMGFYNNNIAPTFDNISNKYRKYMLLKRANFIRKNLAIIARIANAIKKPAKEIRIDLLQGNLKTISLVLLTMGLQKVPFNKDFGIKSLIKMISYKEAISKYIKSKKNMFTDELVTLYENVTKTAKDTSTIVSAIRRSIKGIDVEREMLRTNTHDMIKERIDNIHLSDDEKEVLNDMFVKHKIYRLVQGFSIEEIINILRTPTKYANIYKKQIDKKALPHVERLIKFRTNHIKEAMFRNPFVIAMRFGFKGLKTINAYSTLKGIGSVDSKLITKLKTNKKDFYELLNIANEVELESINKLHNGKYDRLSDNEIIQNSNKVNFVRYIRASDKASKMNAIESGGVLIKQIRNPFSAKDPILIYSVPPLRESYTRGAMVYGNKRVNKSLDALYYELYNTAMPKTFKRSKFASNDNVYTLNRNNSKVFDPLSIDERKQFLNHQDDMQHVYANTMARSFEKSETIRINRKVVDTIVRLSLQGKDTMKKQLDKTDSNEWIELSDPTNEERLDNKFKEINKLWYMLPIDTQNYINSKYNGRVYIKADGNTKNILLGSRDASIANLLRKFPRGRRIVKTMEDWWKSLMGIWKSTVIIKMPHTLAQNALSNIFLTASKGYNFYEIVKYQKEGMLALADYMRTNELLHQEQLKKKTNLPYDEKLIGELQARLENNKIKPLADEGLLATRIEDLTLGNTFDNIKPIQKAIDTLPDEVVKLGSQLYLTKDTNYFKAMYRLTQASDFVARYAQIELEKKYSKKPYTQIFNEALDDFIQYDIPTGKLVRWLDQVTFLPFIKYYLHIQKVISRLVASNPKAVLGLEAFEMNVVNLATPFDDSILFKSPLDKLRDPFGNLDEIVIPEPARWLDSFI